MQLGIPRHQRLHALQIVCVDGLFELRNLSLRSLKPLHMRFEFGPTGEPIQTCDLKLRRGQRRIPARLHKGFGLVFQVAQIGPLGKRTRFLIR